MDLKKLRRKLQRHKAAVKYDASGSFSLSISSSSSSSSSSGGRSSIYIQSMKFYDRNSIRIEGTEGEFNMICRGLGLSGPEDFAIPAAAWKAMQVPSSSDMVPRLKLGRPKEGQEETEEQKPKQDDVAEGGLGEKREDRVRVGDEPAETSGCCAESGGGGVCGGIKGVRPPMLPPPPGMRVPVVDDMCSIWDLVRGFAPQGEGHSLSEGERRMRASTWDGGFAPQGEGHSLSDSEDKQGGEEEEGGEVGGGGGVSPKREEEEEGMDNAARLAEIVAESKEDDSSSTTTGPRFKHISPNSRIKRITTNWQKGELLGRGSLGSVYEGISEDGFFFAMKEVSLLDQGNQGKQRAYQLQQDESNLYLFLELVTKGSLASLYRRYTLQDSQVSAYTRQILYGLKYLHDRNVVHRDIKCANILVDANGPVKLADFGLAKAIKLNDVKSCQGGAFWMAPEVVKGKNQGYGLPADMWSLGCTVLEMLTGEIPYFELEWMQALFRIGKGERPPVPDSLSRDARDFILQCLQVNPDDRPTAAQLLNHPFIERPLSQS